MFSNRSQAEYEAKRVAYLQRKKEWREEMIYRKSKGLPQAMMDKWVHEEDMLKMGES